MRSPGNQQNPGKKTTSDKKRSEAKTDAMKKELLQSPGKEKFEGSLRHKDGKKNTDASAGDLKEY